MPKSDPIDSELMSFENFPKNEYTKNQNTKNENTKKEDTKNEHTINDDTKIDYIKNENKINKFKKTEIGKNNDIASIIILFILYTIQGIPMGLSGSIVLLLHGKISFTKQAIFSLVSLPFSLKIIWAPLVDSLYFKSFGRRKSWLIPVQLVCGGLMLWGSISNKVNEWTTAGTININYLTCFFFALFFLMATQDIAVDGWALTMLSKPMRGYASTCNSIGQTTGFFIAHVGFLALNDPATCNRFFRVEPLDTGIVSLESFLQYLAWTIVVVTILVMFLDEREEEEIYPDSEIKSNKEENEVYTENRKSKNNNEYTKKPKFDNRINHFQPPQVLTKEPHGIREAYKLLWKLGWVPSVQLLICILFTIRIPYAPTDSVTQLKLVECGISKEELAFMAPFIIPFGIVCPMIIGRYTTGSKPLRLLRIGIPLRFVVTGIWAAMLPLTRYVYQELKPVYGVPTWYFVVIYIVTCIHSIASDLMFVSLMAFFSRIADSCIGGTYMTFLNTILNLGYKWTSTASLFLLDYCTRKSCYEDRETHELQCEVILDGYYVECFVCFIFGLIWVYIFSGKMRTVERLPDEQWKIDTLPENRISFKSLWRGETVQKKDYPKDEKISKNL